MGVGAGGVGGDGGLELLLGLGDEALGEIVVAGLGVLGGLLGGRQIGDAHGAHLVELEGCLPEGGLGVGSADAFERIEVGVAGGGWRGFGGRALWRRLPGEAKRFRGGGRS